MALTMVAMVYIDVNSGHGAAAASWQNISDVVRDAEFGHGRARSIDDFQPGQGSVTVDNRSGDYDPSDSGGPFYPDLKLRNRIKVTGYITNSGAFVDEIDLAYGWVEGWPQDWRYRTLVDVKVTWTDTLGVLANAALPDSVWDWQIQQHIDAGRVVAWYRWGDEDAVVIDSSGHDFHGKYAIAQSFDDPTSSALAPPAVVKAGLGDPVIPMTSRPSLNMGKMIAEAGQPAVNTLGGDNRYPCAVLSDATGLWGSGDFSVECWVNPRATFVIDAAGVNQVSAAPEWLFLWGQPDGAACGFGIGTDGKPGVGTARFGDFGLGYATWRHLADTETPLTGTPVDITTDGQTHHLVWAVTNNSGAASWDIEMFVDGASVATWSWDWATCAVGFGRPAIVGRQHAPRTHSFRDDFDSTTTFDPHWTTVSNVSLAGPGLQLDNTGATWELYTDYEFNTLEQSVTFGLDPDLFTGGLLQVGTDFWFIEFQKFGGVNTVAFSVNFGPPYEYQYSSLTENVYRIRIGADRVYFEIVNPSGDVVHIGDAFNSYAPSVLAADRLHIYGASSAGAVRDYSIISFIELTSSTPGVGAGSTVGDVVAYNEVLSSADVLANYRAGKYGNTTASSTPDAATAVANAFDYLSFAAEGVTTSGGTTRSVAAGKLDGRGIVEYARELARGEAGAFFQDGSGVVRWWDESWHRNATFGADVVQFVLTDDGGTYSSDSGWTIGLTDFSVAYDDSLLTNSVTTSFDGGRRLYENSTSIGTYGRYQRSLSTMLTDANDAANLAAYHTWLNADPKVTLERVSFDALESDDAINATVSLAQVGRRIRVVITRPNGTTFDAEHWITAVHHRIDPGANGLWTVTLGLEPADDPGMPLIFDTSSFDSTTEVIWY